MCIYIYMYSKMHEVHVSQSSPRAPLRRVLGLLRV